VRFITEVTFKEVNIGYQKINKVIHQQAIELIEVTRGPKQVSTICDDVTTTIMPQKL